MAGEYRTHHLSAEVVVGADAAARVHSLSAEVVYAPSSNIARVHSLCVEVVRSIADASARRRQQVSIIN